MIRLQSNRGAWFVALLLALVTVCLYFPVRHFDFVQYDDPEYVFENDIVRAGLTRWGIVWSIVDAHASNWHPVTWLSHMMDCQLFGLRPGAHHLVNVFLHGLNSALLFLLLRAMTGAFWRSAFVAALFSWHPLRVESVAWISERKDVLSGLFFLLTLWAYARFASEKGEGRREKEAAGSCPPSAFHHPPFTFYLLALFFFALGLMSKPMLVTAPFVMLLLDYWPLGRVTCDEWRVTALTAVREKTPFFALSLCVGLITFLAQRASGAVIPLKSEGIGARLGGVLSGYLTYLEKLFWPHNLAVLYLRPTSVPAATTALAAIILVAISIWVAVSGARRPYLIAGWLWFVIMLLPVCGILQTGLQSVADRYTYLPSIGIYLMVAWGIGGWRAKSEIRNPKSPARISDSIQASSWGFRPWGSLWISVFGLRIFALAALVGCLVLTRKQIRYWQNTETLMGRALEIDPGNYIAHNDLAVYYDRLGRLEEARQHRQRVRELDPALQGKGR